MFAEIDGLETFVATFVSDGLGQAQLERGINHGCDGAKSDGRRPAILIRRSLRGRYVVHSLA